MVTWSSSSCSMREIAVSWSSSVVRSCITRCARAGSSQRLGSSACRFSSASCVFALSKSKMPPQQPNGPLDVFDEADCFCAHGRHLAAGARERNSEHDPEKRAPVFGSDHAQSLQLHALSQAK